MIEVECVVDAKAELGEATYWDPAEGVLWWIDIYGPTIHRYDPATGTDRTWQAPEYLGTISLRKKGGLVVSMRSGFYFFDPKTGKFTPIVDPESEIADSRFNDGKTDRQGRFWSGSMWEAPGKKPEKIGALWRLDADLSVHKVIHHVGCSNGLAWSPDDKTLYFTDSHTNFVWAYDFDARTGEVANRRTFIDFTSEGYIVDGCTVDAEGNYWLTVPFKGKVLGYDAKGKLIRTVELPFDLPTCCEFGGPGLDVLYVTSALYSRAPRDMKGQTKPGGLFAIHGLGVKGVPLVPFAG
ncbi:MAG TPA: SMP-30/gluconolactonase/LRE family protein [Bauldia sp.]|nr:SMP-30/gluconolactonase/LRE family protein [Bauldia sp.]